MFAGIKLEGGKISYLDERNLEIYKEVLTTEQILFENREVLESVKALHDTVKKYSPSN